MPSRSSSFATRPFARLCSAGISLSVLVAMTPAEALAAHGEAIDATQLRSAEPAEEEAPAEASADGDAVPYGEGNVALLRFTGSPDTSDMMRAAVEESLTMLGYTVKGVKRSMAEAMKKNKCREADDACLGKVAAYLNKNSKTAFDFYVYAAVPGPGQSGELVVYDIANSTVAGRYPLSFSPGDVILETVLPTAIAEDLVRHQKPPGDLSASEQAVMASLDEPEKTPEEVKAEEEALKKAEEERLRAYNQNLDAGAQSIDLKADFEKICRNGPRKDRTIENPDGTTDIERDLTPACSKGPNWGYWQPRAYVALTLTIGSAVTMAAFYGAALGARGQWSDAKDALDASGLSPSDPNNACDGGVCYQDLAGEVSEAGALVRRRAVLGDVFLGSSVVLAGVLGIIISQDRTAARRFLESEAELGISDLRLAPVLGEGFAGGAGGFRF